MKKRTIIIFVAAILLFVVAGMASAQAVSSGSGKVFQLPANSKFTKFIQWLFPALLVTAAILAMAMIVLAGFQWVTAYGNPSKIEDARDRIFNAIIGLILALAAWLILNTINPELVNPRILDTAVDCSTGVC